jgi:hypothetical protein
MRKVGANRGERRIAVNRVREGSSNFGSGLGLRIATQSRRTDKSQSLGISRRRAPVFCSARPEDHHVRDRRRTRSEPVGHSMGSITSTGTGLSWTESLPKGPLSLCPQHFTRSVPTSAQEWYPPAVISDTFSVSPTTCTGSRASKSEAVPFPS